MNKEPSDKSRIKAVRVLQHTYRINTKYQGYKPTQKGGFSNNVFSTKSIICDTILCDIPEAWGEPEYVKIFMLMAAVPLICTPIEMYLFHTSITTPFLTSAAVSLTILLLTSIYMLVSMTADLVWRSPLGLKLTTVFLKRKLKKHLAYWKNNILLEEIPKHLFEKILLKKYSKDVVKLAFILAENGNEPILYYIKTAQLALK